MTRPRGVEANVFALKPGSTLSAHTLARESHEMAAHRAPEPRRRARNTAGASRMPGSTISARTHARDICEGGSNGPNVLRDGRTLAP